MRTAAIPLLSWPVLALAAACGGSAPAPAPAEPAAPDPQSASGVYSEAQAARGRAAFRAVCAECHYSSEFRGSQFQFEWRRRSVGDLYAEIVSNMPEDDPGSLEDQVYVDIVAYILQLNGFAPGSRELPPDEAVLDGLGLGAPGQGRE